MSHLLLPLQDLLQIPNFCTLNPPLILLVISTLIVSPVFGSLSLEKSFKSFKQNLKIILWNHFITHFDPDSPCSFPFAPVDHALLYLYTIISLKLFDLSNRPSVTFCHCHLTVILYLPFVFVYCKAIIINNNNNNSIYSYIYNELYIMVHVCLRIIHSTGTSLVKVRGCCGHQACVCLTDKNVSVDFVQLGSGRVPVEFRHTQSSHRRQVLLVGDEPCVCQV